MTSQVTLRIRNDALTPHRPTFLRNQNHLSNRTSKKKQKKKTNSMSSMLQNKIY